MAKDFRALCKVARSGKIHTWTPLTDSPTLAKSKCGIEKKIDQLDLHVYQGMDCVNCQRIEAVPIVHRTSVDHTVN